MIFAPLFVIIGICIGFIAGLVVKEILDDRREDHASTTGDM